MTNDLERILKVVERRRRNGFLHEVGIGFKTPYHEEYENMLYGISRMVDYCCALEAAIEANERELCRE